MLGVLGADDEVRCPQHSSLNQAEKDGGQLLGGGVAADPARLCNGFRRLELGPRASGQTQRHPQIPLGWPRKRTLLSAAALYSCFEKKVVRLANFAG